MSNPASPLALGLGMIFGGIITIFACFIGVLGLGLLLSNWEPDEQELAAIAAYDVKQSLEAGQ